MSTRALSPSRFRPLRRLSGRRDVSTEAAALFVLIGATPHTDWLPQEILHDEWGYVLTGTDRPDRRREPPDGLQIGGRLQLPHPSFDRSGGDEAPPTDPGQPRRRELAPV